MQVQNPQYHGFSFASQSAMFYKGIVDIVLSYCLLIPCGFRRGFSISGRLGKLLSNFMKNHEILRKSKKYNDKFKKTKDIKLKHRKNTLEVHMNL